MALQIAGARRRRQKLAQAWWPAHRAKL